MTAPARDGDFDAVLSEIRSGTTAISDTVNAVIGGVTAMLTSLPATTPIQPVLDGLEQLRRANDRILGEMAEFLAYAGDPEHLRATGAVWAGDIGGTTSRLAGSATFGAVRADDHWTGTAADAYRFTLGPQAGALTAIKATGDELDATLNDLANGIREFWSAVSGTLIALGVALAAALATTLSVIGTPLAVGIAVPALVAAGSALNDARDAFVQITNDTSTRSAEIQRRLADDTAFPAGAWPRAVVPISGDGSITDGDDTDWHLR